MKMMCQFFEMKEVWNGYYVIKYKDVFIIVFQLKMDTLDIYVYIKMKFK